MLKCRKDSSYPGKTKRMISNDKELITLIARGMSTKQIAPIMRHTESAVETQRSKLMKRVRVRNAPELVAYAFRNKILTIE